MSDLLFPGFTLLQGQIFVLDSTTLSVIGVTVSTQSSFVEVLCRGWGLVYARQMFYHGVVFLVHNWFFFPDSKIR